MEFKIGTEAWEQQQLCTWLDINGYKYSAIINDMWTSSFKQKAKQKAIGMKPGLSDLLIVLKRKSLLFLEMKKAKGPNGGLNGSKISENQRGWRDVLNEIDNIQYEFGYGYKDGVNLIKRLEEN